MRSRTYVVCNAGEPDNLLEFWYDEKDDLVRAHASAEFRDGALQTLIERTVTGWVVCVDGRCSWCASFEEAWAKLPALLAEPDHVYEATNA